MKKLQTIILSLIPLLILCSCNSNTEIAPTKGHVEFAFSKIERSEGSRITTATTTPAFIVLSIEDTDGNDAVKDEKLELQAFGQGYTTESVELTTGNYKLIKFLVLNADNTVIYATPLDGSDLAHYINDPLPFNFSIIGNSSVQIIPQVLAVNQGDNADSFGYAIFGFDVRKSKKLLSKEYFTFDVNKQHFVTSFKTSYKYKNNRLNEAYDLDYNVTTDAYDTTGNKLYEFHYNNDGKLSQTVNFLGQNTHFIQDYEYPSSTSTKVTEYELIGGTESGKFWRIVEKTASTMEIKYLDENNVTSLKLNYEIDSAGNLKTLEMTPSNIVGNIQYQYDRAPNPEYFPEFIETPFDVIQRYSKNNVKGLSRIGYQVTSTIIYDEDGFPIEVTHIGTDSEYDSKTIYTYTSY